jgi:hypothetical protein
MAMGYGLNVPDDVDLDDNLSIASNDDWYNPVSFYHRVDYGGPWDYKSRDKNYQKYQDFGNYHFGVMAAAAGFSEDTIVRMAGWAHQRHLENPQDRDGLADNIGLLKAAAGIGGKPPFGDDPRDQYWIKKGIDDYQRVHDVGRYADGPFVRIPQPEY